MYRLTTQLLKDFLITEIHCIAHSVPLIQDLYCEQKVGGWQLFCSLLKRAPSAMTGDLVSLQIAPNTFL